MKLFSILFVFFFSFAMLAQEAPVGSLEELMLQAEEDLTLLVTAKQTAIDQNLPLNVVTSDGVFYDVIGVQNGQPVYAKITDPAHPFTGDAVFFSQIASETNLADSRVNWGNGRIEDNRSNLPDAPPQIDTRAATKLLVPESTNDAVMTFDATTGDLIDQTFIADPTNLSTPISANLTPWATITVSDQINDYVVQYDTNGVFDQILCSSVGTDTLNNIRGHAIHPTNGTLLITVGSGAMTDAVVEYGPDGIYRDQFITPDATKSDSPFDIIFRANDCLVCNSTSDNVYRYDHSGTPLDELISDADLEFPEQMQIADNGDIVIGEFSASSHGSGVAFFDAAGTWQKTLTGVTGNRGVYILGNGNVLTTNGAGVHEIDGTSGALIRTVVANVSGRFIEPFDVSVIPVELTGFRANVVDGNVVLNWATATETNNSGFQVQRSIDNELFTVVDFVEGHGTSTEKHSYTYTDNGVTAGTYYYRLKQIDFDGTFAYSPIITVEVDAPSDYALNQNYPNPFNPSTMISFALPVEAHVTVTVYNSLGETVTTLMSETLESGRHEVQFNALDLSSGLYFYNVNAEGIDGSRYNETMKMMLMK